MNHHGQPFVRWGDSELPSPPHTGIRAPSEDPAWQDNENCCCVASTDLSSYSNTTDATSNPKRISHYVNMGLNRPHPLAPYCTPEFQNGGTIEAPEPEKMQSVRMKNYLRALEEDEGDLAELAEQLVPAELRSLDQQREDSSHYGWQPINKTKTPHYNEWQLTFGGESNPKGWKLVDSAATSGTPDGGISMADTLARQEGDTPIAKHLATDAPVTPVDAEITGENLKDADDSLWIDEKYFDHYGYLNHVNSVDGNENDELLKIQTKLRTQDRKGVQLTLDQFLSTSPALGKPLAFPGQPVKSLAKRLTIKRKPKNERDPPVHDTFDIHHQAKTGTSDDTSSDEIAKWVLLEGNVDAPRTGNVLPHKLTIKLRNTMTDERKTLTYTDVEHDEVDWKSKQQIAAIIRWRTGVFHEHGINTKKNVLIYTPLEDAWMTLFHRKLRAIIEAGHMIKLPGPSNIMVPFNAYFEGKTLKDTNGETVGPRPARDATSIRGKLDGRASKIAEMRKEMRGLLPTDNGGPISIPTITEEELLRFQKDGSVAVEVPKDASKDASSGSDGKGSRKSSPKRKREKGGAGEQDGKKAKRAGEASPSTRR
ncbi:hypothetical protein AA0112_g11672 [Alternaria arborescens]|uniref:hypothetical protein n=1 Tax=Alternaria arborescens TaxID=156630 RepID=UPI001074D52E|nr:hypothetical protein AA0111_g10393 [Alternaria arborescens]RYN18215.1 hypothetical protein AA0112_g11672 [Alternaria arborescens]RYO19216.1 hypothetical protein AA0111_g10393 [Alternaria arborescens]